ncbi:MAG: STAS domain-containing protein, partial [Solirubrobacteraceae bacterium]
MLQSDAHIDQEAAVSRPPAPAVHAPSPPFACRWGPGCAGGAWVEACGELDLATSPELRAALRDAQSHARLVALDLRALTFMDASGVHTILDATAAAHRRRGRLVLVCSPGAADRVLTLTAGRDQVQMIE